MFNNHLYCRTGSGSQHRSCGNCFSNFGQHPPIPCSGNHSGSTGLIGPTGPAGPQGPIGPAGPAGPAAATIPFSIGYNGVTLLTDDNGNPESIAMPGFSAGPGEYATIYLQEGEWASGQINLRNSPYYGSPFVMPYSATLRTLRALFATSMLSYGEVGSLIYPFACVATASPDSLIFTVLPGTLVYGEPFMGGIEYPKHTTRTAAATGLNIAIPEGTLVALIIGIRAENVTDSQYSMLCFSGGLYLE